MRCLVCNTAMLIREGRFGQFYYCPNGSHGTISVVKYEKAIKKLFTEGTREQVEYDPLITTIERQTLALGGVGDLERFYVDSEAYYDDPDDFWQNQRPY